MGVHHVWRNIRALLISVSVLFQNSVSTLKTRLCDSSIYEGFGCVVLLFWFWSDLKTPCLVVSTVSNEVSRGSPTSWTSLVFKVKLYHLPKNLPSSGTSPYPTEREIEKSTQNCQTHGMGYFSSYCWWKKSWWNPAPVGFVVYPIIYRVSYIPGGTGFLLSAVPGTPRPTIYKWLCRVPGRRLTSSQLPGSPLPQWTCLTFSSRPCHLAFVTWLFGGEKKDQRNARMSGRDGSDRING